MKTFYKRYLLLWLVANKLCTFFFLSLSLSFFLRLLLTLLLNLSRLITTSPRKELWNWNGIISFQRDNSLIPSSFNYLIIPFNFNFNFNPIFKKLYNLIPINRSIFHNECFNLSSSLLLYSNNRFEKVEICNKKLGHFFPFFSTSWFVTG